MIEILFSEYGTRFPIRASVIKEDAKMFQGRRLTSYRYLIGDEVTKQKIEKAEKYNNLYNEKEKLDSKMNKLLMEIFNDI